MPTLMLYPADALSTTPSRALYLIKLRYSERYFIYLFIPIESARRGEFEYIIRF